jgi:hypothetical protein
VDPSNKPADNPDTFDDGRRSFRDAFGRDWPLRVSVATVGRLRDQMGVDLPAIVEKPLEFFARLTDDDIFLAGCIWATVEPEAGRRNVSAEEFADGLAGDALFDAGRVFAAAVVDFFRDPRVRESVRGVLAKAWQVVSRSREIGASKVSAGLAGVDVERLAATLPGLSGNAPESSASTPTP